jgi:cytochrome c556
LVAFIVACAAAFVVGSPSRASAQDVVPGPWGDLVDHVRPLTIESDNQRVVLFRRQHMRAQSAHFRAIEAVVKYNAPFRSTINSDAVALQALARRLDTLFPPGTAMPPGTYGAKPEIWLQPDKFAQHISGFRKAVDDLVLAAASGGDMSAAFTAARHQCLACHQVFRVFENRR